MSITTRGTPVDIIWTRVAGVSAQYTTQFYNQTDSDIELYLGNSPLVSDALIIASGDKYLPTFTGYEVWVRGLGTGNIVTMRAGGAPIPHPESQWIDGEGWFDDEPWTD